MKAADKKEAMRGLMNDLAIRVDDAALLLDIDRKVAYGAVRDGKIPSIRIGRLIRVPTAGLANCSASPPKNEAAPVDGASRPGLFCPLTDQGETN